MSARDRLMTALRGNVYTWERHADDTMTATSPGEAADAILAADPDLARHIELGEAVERLEVDRVWHLTIGPDHVSVSWWDKTWFTFTGPTLDAAIAAALDEGES